MRDVAERVIAGTLRPPTANRDTTPGTTSGAGQ